MRIVTMFTTAAFVALFSVSAMAQTATPSTTTTTPSATTTTPSATTAAPAAKSATTKPKAMKPAQTAVSKACSAQADAKGLHGKARAKFRSDCKKSGGKA
ncbi:PsiF family protein [Rhizobium sp. P44RR-XXIV]|uniref:PsiF family protein n=1 Tax=Rhizobium sp. P44RR-XXIV TaxID=1921145 RepID=UPI000984A49F|nr:PsiF family protein [Rhizobium sp. P44RR-XXIV]TIX89153.1 lipase chaperone [Rhizobium sp. P44RR-XXIV]